MSPKRSRPRVKRPAKSNKLAQVLERLEPGLSDSDRRYIEHFPKGTDLLVVVVKGHLLAEEILNGMLATLSRHPEVLQRARLTFAQLVTVLKAISPYPTDYWLWSALTDLNTLRNRLAHRLGDDSVPGLSRNLAAFIETCGARVRLGPPQVEPAAALARALAYALGHCSVQLSILAAAKDANALDELGGQ